MNIALIRPKPEKDSIGLQSFMICEPLELEYASTLLKSLGHKVIILDMMFENKPLSKLLREFKPDLAGFTGYITHVAVVKRYAQEVKTSFPDCLTMVGGVHAEVAPGDFEDESMDYILHVNALASLREMVMTDITNREAVRAHIPGIWNGPGKSYEIGLKFDFPHPDREAVAQYRDGYNYIFHEKCAIVKTSFGCSFRCDFCFCVAITRGKYFERPIADVVDEIGEIKEKNIFIVDDNFLFNTARIREFARLIQERGIRKRYILFGRADYIVKNEDVILLLKEIGLTAVFVGIESFRQEDLRNYNKKTSVELNENAVRILESNGLECYSGIVVGMDWAKEDFDGLIKWLNRFQHPIINLQPVTPMPGTPLAARMKGQTNLPQEEYAKWDMAHLVWKPLRMSAREYYGSIMRTYLKTMVALKGNWYV